MIINVMAGRLQRMAEKEKETKRTRRQWKTQNDRDMRLCAFQTTGTTFTVDNIMTEIKKKLDSNEVIWDTNHIHCGIILENIKIPENVNEFEGDFHHELTKAVKELGCDRIYRLRMSDNTLKVVLRVHQGFIQRINNALLGNVSGAYYGFDDWLNGINGKLRVVLPRFKECDHTYTPPQRPRYEDPYYYGGE